MVLVDQAAEVSEAVATRGLRNAGVYALAAAIQRALTFLLLPLYTHALTPAEYGRLSVVLTITTAASILFSLGLDYGLFRAFFRLASDPTHQREFVESVWSFLIGVVLASAGLISVLVGPWLGSSGTVRGPELVLGLVGIALFVAATTVPLSLLRAQERLRDYLILNAVLASTTSIFTVTFVVVLDEGVQGWLIAVLLANAVSLLAALVVIPWRVPRRFRRDDVREAVILSLPLVPHFAGHWGLQLANRAVLAGIVSTSTVGIYSLAATLAMPAMILVQSLNLGFMPSYASAGVRSDERSHLRGIVTLQASMALALCLAVALLAPCVVSLLVDPSYAPASPVIPWITLGFAFLGLYYIPMNGLGLGAGRTRFVWIATMFAAVTNLALLYLLVPNYGIKSAAIASAVGYLVLLAAVGWHSRHPDNPVTYDWRKLIVTVAVIAGAYAGATLTSDASSVLDVVVRLLWIGAATLGLMLSGSLPAQRVRALVVGSPT